LTEEEEEEEEEEVCLNGPLKDQKENTSTNCSRTTIDDDSIGRLNSLPSLHGTTHNRSANGLGVSARPARVSSSLCDPDHWKYISNTPLMVVLLTRSRSDLDGLQALVAAEGVAVLNKTNRGGTALHHAALHGRLNVVQYIFRSVLITYLPALILGGAI
jgi:hypothetical protein